MKRRDFVKLAAAGSAAAGLRPFLPTQVRAQTEGPPKRLLVIFTGLGTLEDTFWPTAGPSGRPDDFTLGATQSALEPFREHLIYPDGLVNYGHTFWNIQDGNNHKVGGTCVFSASRREEGESTGPSFDQVIADHLWDEANPVTPHRSIHLGVGAGRCPPFHRAAGQRVRPLNNPETAFDSLFADAVGEEDEAARALRGAKRQSVLDYVRGDLQRVRTRIGRQEADVLDAHLTHVRALERRLQSARTCATPTRPRRSDDNEAFRQQMDLLATAFACDMTRVATLEAGHCDGGFKLVEGLNTHGTTHSVGQTKDSPAENRVAQDNHRILDRAWADHWAYLLEQLASIPEGDGTVLDNTLVVWGSDTTTHNVGSIGPHKHTRFPYVLAGGRNFAFPTGRYLQYERPPRGRLSKAEHQALLQSHSRLWVSILQRFGVETETFGELDVGSGTLPDL